MWPLPAAPATASGRRSPEFRPPRRPGFPPPPRRSTVILPPRGPRASIGSGVSPPPRPPAPPPSPPPRRIRCPPDGRTAKPARFPTRGSAPSRRLAQARAKEEPWRRARRGWPGSRAHPSGWLDDERGLGDLPGVAARDRRVGYGARGAAPAVLLDVRGDRALMAGGGEGPDPRGPPPPRPPRPQRARPPPPPAAPGPPRRSG